MSQSRNFSIVHEKNFILATRDTGYRSTASAVAELVDNAIQARAKVIRIFVEQEGVGVERRVRLAVLDDGIGMDRKTLRTALRFGGSSRFDDRSGQGRFGMGLPNASVSQARRVEVYSWSKGEATVFSYLDVDEIEAGNQSEVPLPKSRDVPAFARRYVKKSGTLVIWDRCDRLDNRKASTVAEKLLQPLGQQFRYFLQDGLSLSINGVEVEPFDPLFLNGDSATAKAVPFGKSLEYEVRIPNSPSRTSIVTVRFSELPINEWYALPIEEKRDFGITKAAGVSVIRAKREIDYGWWFFGDKRKENYDDWWRCEISFEPELDEYFGVTHSKQSITPTDELKAILVPDLEGIAHTLNSRVRSAYLLIRANENTSPTAGSIASDLEPNLRPLPDSDDDRSPEENRGPSRHPISAERNRLKYAITTQRLATPDFFVFDRRPNGRISITVNANHPFFERVYSRLASSGAVSELLGIECLIVAAVRAELETDGSRRSRLTGYRSAWSNALAAYLDR